jgi:hypothetical protein
MRRRTFDVIASTIGLGLAALLLVAGGLLTWASTFVDHQVHNQLSSQKIFFPAKDSEGLKALKGDDLAAISKYAGQQLTTGAQAEAFANHYIAVHLKGVGGGQTYSQLSGKALANPTDQKLAGQVATMFKGETLRGLLLNAYAFGKMGTIAGIAAITSFIGAGAMLILGGLGLWHARRVPADQEVLGGNKASATSPVPATVH